MIVIDAGHGGNDPGTSGNGMLEKDYTLLISTYMYEKFKNLGLDVKIVRTTDETLTPSQRVERIMSAYGSDPNVIVISNHLNAGGGSGAEVIYALRNSDELSKLILENLGKVGISTRKVYQRTLPSDPSKDYYFIHRDTVPNESVIIEYGFLDNKNDADFIRKNYEKLADSVVASVIEYIGFEANNNNNNNFMYTIVKGDSLYSIATKFDTTVDKIKSLNNLLMDTIYINQEILIPNSLTYKVEQGDTLYSIAKSFDTSVDSLKTFNNLSSDVLSINQILKIPSSSANTVYIVKAGDTLYSIAKQYNTSVEDIKKVNNLKNNILTIGFPLKL